MKQQASRRTFDRTRLGQFADLGADAPQLPDDLSTLSHEEVGTLHAELEALYATERAAAEGSVEKITALAPMVDAIVALRTEADRRINEPGQAAAAAADLDARLAVAPVVEAPAATEPVPAGDLAVTEPAPAPAPVVEAPALPTAVVTSEPAPVTAALPLVPDLPGQRRLADRADVEPIRPGMVITAAGEIPNYSAGDHMEGLEEIGNAIFEKRKAIGRPGQNVGSDQITVASIAADWPEDRHLRPADSLSVIKNKVAEVNGLEAMTAAGGLCVPVTPYYEIMTIAQAKRPVQAALASFQADRGGIRLVPPPQLVDAAGSIGFITAAQDAAALGGNSGQIAAATKPCLHVTCPGVVEYDVAAITRCLEFGNLTAKTYPEQVTAWTALALAQWARKAETALLDIISAHSTQITLAATMGAARDIVAGIVRAAAYYRNHNRTDQNMPLRVMLPAWILDAMVADLTKGSGYELEFFSMARQQIVDALGELNINVSFYLDSGTGKGQLINGGSVQGSGALTTFPSTCVYYMFSEGSFLWLDSGSLDLGVVRDATLNSLNNYRIFAESWETAAFVGVESLEVTQSIAVNGTFAGPAYGSTTVSSPVAIPTS